MCWGRHELLLVKLWLSILPACIVTKHLILVDLMSNKMLLGISLLSRIFEKVREHIILGVHGHFLLFLLRWLLYSLLVAHHVLHHYHHLLHLLLKDYHLLGVDVWLTCLGHHASHHLLHLLQLLLLRKIWGLLLLMRIRGWFLNDNWLRNLMI